MSKQFDVLVTIGRFQPFHLGHKAVIDEALKQAKEVVVVVGSSFAARNIRNPFTFEERKQMIKSVYPSDRVKVVPVSDYPYNDNKWVAAIQTIVNGAISYTPDPIKIGLIGHNKDSTSYYLKIFPTWDNIEVDNFDNINATDIRKGFLADGGQNNEMYLLPPSVKNFLNKFIETLDWKTLQVEQEMMLKYKQAWSSAPFTPTFVTVDTVVIQSGHILLVKRKGYPGKGLFALPGGFLNQNETMLDGSIRELKEETGIKVPIAVLKGSIKDSKVFDHPNRSTRGRTITQAFFVDLGFDKTLPKVKGSDDAEKAFWMPFNKLRQDQFFEDHWHIVDYFTNIG